MATPKSINVRVVIASFARELHNILVVPTEEGGLKESSDEDNNIIIIDSTLQTFLPPQLKNMSSQYKVMCVCECCIYTKIMHSSSLS